MIPAFDASAGYQAIKPEIDDAIRRVFESGRFILGREVEAFEHEFAEYVGARGAVGVASGTEAITLAMMALGIGAGDEVITVANTAVPTVAAIRAAGAIPRFVDVRVDSLVMDPEYLEAAISPKTRCILPVHLYGHPALIDEILEIAGQHGLDVVEDCAQAHGARWRGRHVGLFGRIGCFSFYPTKNLGAYGDGGISISNEPELIERLRALRTYGFRNDGIAHEEGINSRLDELQAAILRVKLRHLEKAVAARRSLAERYEELLTGSDVRLPVEIPPAQHAYHLYVVRAAERCRLIETFNRANIGSGIHYPVPIHLMPAYRFLEYERGALPITEAAAGQVISLPLYPEMEEAVCATVADAVRVFHFRP